MAALDLRCPTCGLHDKVEKVSIIAENEVIQSTSEFGTHTEPSPLAESLARPEKPTRNTSAGCGLLLGVILMLFGGVGLDTGTSAERPLSVLLLVLGLLILIIGIAVDNKQKKEYQHLLARWPKAEERWNQLYYCRHDGTVFNPYDGASMQVKDMNPYLWS